MPALAATHPDKLAIWPQDEGGFGIDVRWSGGDGDRRAALVCGLLEQSQVSAKVTESRDGWELHVGPVPGVEVARVIDQFVW